MPPSSRRSNAAEQALTAAQNALQDKKDPVIERIEQIFKEIFMRMAKVILHIILKIVF